MQKFLGRIGFVLLILTSFAIGQMRDHSQPLPIHHAPNKEFHMIHLGLNFHFNIEKKEVLGVATEKIVPFLNDYKTIHLNAVDMKIDKVILNGKNLSFNYDGKILSINLDKNYGLDDTLTYSITYSTIPKKGIFFILPDKAYPKRIPEIWSQSESEDAQYWYPCHDYPDDFSTSSLTATVPEDWVVVSNGLLKKTTTDKKDRTKTFYWDEEKPHVVYLNSIVAGKYKILKTKWDNVPIYYYVEPQFANEAMENFSHTPDILKFFSEVTGHHYEWDKLSLSTVQDFTEGGMENVSAITLTNTTFHDKNAEPQTNSTDLVSHETAHQWFGDLLTCRNWANAWLNEGFATFFEALYGQHAFGNDHYVYEMSKDQEQVVNADKRERRPIVYNRYNSPDDVFGVYIYPRGADVLNMLRFVLGDQLFFKAIKHYVKEYQFHNVDTHDFEKAVQEATGQNLYWFFDEWVYKAGHPVFKVKYNYNPDIHKLIMTVDQTQKVDSLTPVYKMPVEVYIETPSEKIIKRVWVDSLENTFSFDVKDLPLMVNFDEGHELLKEMDFKKSAEELVYQLQNDKDVDGRIWAADQLEKTNSEASVNALENVLKKDSFWAVRAECAKILGSSKQESVEQALIAALNDKDARVQVNAINSLANFNDSKTGDLFKNKFEKDKNYFVRAAALTAYSKLDSSKALPAIDQALKINSQQEVIRTAALDALTKIDSLKAYSEAEKFAEYGQPEPIRIRSVMTLVQHDANKNNTIKLLEKFSDDPYWIVRLISVNELGRIGDKSALPILEKREKEEVNFRIVESIKRSIAQIKNRES